MSAVYTPHFFPLARVHQPRTTSKVVRTRKLRKRSKPQREPLVDEQALKSDVNITEMETTVLAEVDEQALKSDLDITDPEMTVLADVVVNQCPVSFDAKDTHKPQVGDFLLDHYRRMEGCRAASPTYMSRQSDINGKMREILIDWLVEVHLKFKLLEETLFLTVNVIDRFLEQRAVQRSRLQLVGCTAMLISAKYEEIYPPEVRDFIYISDNAYTRDEILAMESIMLNTLKFNLTVPSALRFSEHFLETAHASTKTTFLTHYLMELALQNYKSLKFLPSIIAASACYLALHMINDQKWVCIDTCFLL